MTCIVAKVSEGKIHMAGDKFASNGYTGFVTKRPKVFKSGEFLIGYCGSFRKGQLLEFNWGPPDRKEGGGQDEYIYSTVVQSFKNIFSWAGFEDKEEGGCFIFGYRGSLYSIQSDYSVFEFDSYAAVGSGEDDAMAALYVLDNVQTSLTVEEELALAITAASSNKVSVSTVYDYIRED